VALTIAAVASLALAAFILQAPKEKETWAALTGVLAVIAAIIGAFPALRMLEIQEDALRPRPTPYFDLTSRYSLLQLRVKNLGGGVAYDVQLKWEKHLVNHKGEEVDNLDHISVLLPQDSVSVLIGASTEFVRKLSDSQFEGECSCRDATGKKYCQNFICSVDGSQKQLVHDNELPKTLRDLQKLPEELNRIAEAIKQLPGAPS
jgi:Fe-S cluster assembly iron-binding protein IscA